MHRGSYKAKGGPTMPSQVKTHLPLSVSFATNRSNNFEVPAGCLRLVWMTAQLRRLCHRIPTLVPGPTAAPQSRRPESLALVRRCFQVSSPFLGPTPAEAASSHQPHQLTSSFRRRPSSVGTAFSASSDTLNSEIQFLTSRTGAVWCD